VLHPLEKVPMDVSLVEEGIEKSYNRRCGLGAHFSSHHEESKM
jgi:hypothetical protein